MKCSIRILFFLLLANALQAQQPGPTLEAGTVSFVSSRNVYVKFNSTKDINKGDTLYMNQANQLLPVLIVDNKSSASTVCTAIGGVKMKVKDEVFVMLMPPESKIVEEEIVDLPIDEEPITSSNELVVTPDEDRDAPEEEVLFKEKVKGRVSVASYSNLSQFRNRHRMRYAFAFRGHNLKNSRFSTESYITFRHTLNDSIRLADALKVYSLNVKYEFDKNTHLTFGRKINPNFSSMGAIDDLQFHKGWGAISIGAVAGTRPDFRDYSLNTDLLQFGAYIGLGSNSPNAFSQTTIGIVEQTNKGNTDRRFVYMQHSSTLAKNLSFFGSAEVDLYERVNNETKNAARLTNLYASVRYRFSRKFRISASYDTRRNIIYYESYKNVLDQLIEDETRQGLRVGFNHRVFKGISWGANGSMRFQKSRRNPSRGASGYINFSRVPYINARASLRASFLQTDFLESQIFGARLSKELTPGRLSADIYYRWVDYKYTLGDRVVHQDIGGASLSINIQKQLTLYLFYEGVLDKVSQNYHRFNVRLIKRF